MCGVFSSSFFPLPSQGGSFAGAKVGVSVTRAMKYNPGPEAYGEADALHDLEKKLVGLGLARRDVAPEHRCARHKRVTTA